jgi:uncharacterized membrane protein
MPPGNEPSSPHAWLHGELPALLKEGVLTEESAAALRKRYPLTSDAEATLARQKRSTNWAMILFGILGAVLIGGGIILLLAHNWEQLDRPARTTVAFAPLLLGQALAFWMLWTGRGTTWGRETVGTFVALMVGACLALVSQTYHLGGDFAAFMLVWTLLSLPVAYLLRATLPALWFCAAAVIWGFSMDWNWRWRDQGNPAWFWLLLALVLPLWWWEARQAKYGPRAVLLGWTVAGAGCFGVAFVTMRGWNSTFTVFSHAGWYALLYLVGRRWFGEGRTIWQRPLQFIGVVGAAFMALFLTFSDEIWARSSSSSADLPIMTLAFTFLWPALALLLWAESLRREDLPARVVGAFPALIAAAMLLPENFAHFVPIIFNCYLFAAGIALLVAGLRRHQLGTVNGGMLILSALVLCRFFDADLGFVLRGLAFIGLGVGFLVANFLLLRRRRALP